MTGDRLLGLSALLISIGTLAVFLYQTKLIREQQHMSVYPYLELANTGSNTDHYVFKLMNKGIGPAIIESIEIIKDDEVVSHDLATYVNQSLQGNDSIGNSYSNLYSGRLISPAEDIPIVEASDGSITTSQLLFSVINDRKLQCRIIYTSIYGERWLLSSNKAVPERIDS